MTTRLVAEQDEGAGSGAGSSVIVVRRRKPVYASSTPRTGWKTKMKPTGLFPLIVAITFAFASGSSAMAQNPSPSATDWPTYGNDPGGQRYSSLDQINKQNVGQLKVAWTYHTGDVSDGSDGRRWSAFENTPS